MFSYKEIHLEIKNNQELILNISKIKLKSKEYTYFLKPKFIYLAKKKIAKKKGLFFLIKFLLKENYKFFKEFIVFLFKGYEYAIPECKKINGKFCITRNISRLKPPNYNNLTDQRIINKRVYFNIFDFIEILNLFNKSKYPSTYLHVYFKYIKDNIDFKNAFFIWEDGLDNLSRIISNLTNIYGKGSEGYVSSFSIPSSMLLRLFNSFKIFTNNKELLNLCNFIYSDQKNRIIFKKYNSECFSGSLTKKYKIKYSIGIVLPLDSPKSNIGKKFISIFNSFNTKTLKLLISIHPQSDDKWKKVLKSKYNFEIRDSKKISDIEFISICKEIIGAESSLRSLANDLNKNYVIINS